jgi:Ankyrin repeats (3 copies)
MEHCTHYDFGFSKKKNMTDVRRCDKSSLGDRNIHWVHTSSAFIEELPPEISFQILQFLNTDSLIDMRSLSETCYVLNQMIGSFLQERWSCPSSIVSVTHHDGIIQRLCRQDPQTFSRLLDDVCCSATLPKSMVDHGTSEGGVCLRLQNSFCRTLQDQQQRAAEFLTSSSLLQQPIVQDLRQQMSDRFLDAISLQRNLAILLYTHTGIGVILVTVVSIGLFWVKTKDDFDFCSSHSCPMTRIEEEERLLGSPFYMRFLVVLAFAFTVAYGVSKQSKSQKERRKLSLHRSVSQPELNGHSKTSFVGMKRSQTVASGLVSFGDLSHSSSFESDRVHGYPETIPSYFSLGLVDGLVEDDVLDVDENHVSDVLTVMSSPEECATSHVDECREEQSRESIAYYRSPPRGCVGIFYRAVQHAKERLVHIVQERRSQSFDGLDPAERAEFSATYLNACSNDSAILSVQILSRSLPTQQFYIAPDGTESCALHIAAFHGSAQIIDFLCRGIDATYDPNGEDTLFTYEDGGLCDVNVTDANGWTALHYAAGANSVNAVRVLVEHHGANLNIPAVNGYTPLQWALRLKHHAVAELLRSYVESHNLQYQKRCVHQLLLQVQKSLPSVVILSFLLLYFVSKDPCSKVS